jgi:hypothetical protein
VKPVVIHPQAQAELEEACAYYEERRAGLGRELRLAVEAAVVRSNGIPEWEVGTSVRGSGT